LYVLRTIINRKQGDDMSSHSQFGPDPSRASAHSVGAAGAGLAAGIASAVGVGIVNAMNARSLADGRSITVAEWRATVNFLEGHCQLFDKQVKELSLENLQLRAQLEIALCRAKRRS
jgi:hypothetical protein